MASLGIPAHRLGLTRTKVTAMPGPDPSGPASADPVTASSPCTLIEAFAATFREVAGVAQGRFPCVHAAASAALCALFEVGNPSPEQQLRAVAEQLWHVTGGGVSASGTASKSVDAPTYLFGFQVSYLSRVRPRSFTFLPFPSLPSYAALAISALADACVALMLWFAVLEVAVTPRRSCPLWLAMWHW